VWGAIPKSEGEATEVAQLWTVEAMCRANWPAQQQPTKAE
jgi:hypothetical protein